MVVPSRSEAAALLVRFSPQDWFLAHVAAVADIAAGLGRAFKARGHAVDLGLIEAAALLHDIDKLLPSLERPPLPHGAAGARWLSEIGHPELAEAVASHPVTELATDRGSPWWEAAPAETRIVAYADKRAGQRLQPMASRFADWRGRHPEHAADLARAWPRALRLEALVCGQAGLAPDQVGRLRWARRTLNAADLTDGHRGGRT